MQSRRAEIVKELVEFKTSSEPLIQELRSFGWGWDGEPLLIITREPILSVIERCLKGELSNAQLQEWAENLEVREDVAFDPRYQVELDDICFRIANPEINEPLTPAVIQGMKAELESLA
jgi:hypothetical protein